MTAGKIIIIQYLLAISLREKKLAISQFWYQIHLGREDCNSLKPLDWFQLLRFIETKPFIFEINKSVKINIIIYRFKVKCHQSEHKTDIFRPLWGFVQIHGCHGQIRFGVY